MTSPSRRTVLSAALSTSVLALFPRSASAALARGLTLVELARASRRALIGTALDSYCEWATFRGVRAIVTDTRVRVEEPIAGDASARAELRVRTLGGSIGDLGEFVAGQARLFVGESALLFLTPALGVEFVTGMAQGHFPLRAAAGGETRLKASPDLPELLGRERSAAGILAGKELGVARRLVREVFR